MAVNGVNSYVSDAIKYINGMPVVQNGASITKDTVDAVKSTPSFTIFEMAPKVYNGARYGLNSAGVAGFGGAIKSLSDMDGLVDDTMQLQKGLKDASMNYDALTAIYKAKSATGVAGSEAANLADNAIQLAKKGLAAGDKELIEQAGMQAQKAADVAKTAAKEAKPGLFTKLKNFFKTGVRESADDVAKAVVNSADDVAAGAADIAGGAAKTGMLGTIGKACKKSGAGVMAAIDGVIELFTNVIPAFQAGGAKSGVKQLGKSTVKVAASTGGFVAGSAAGKAIGAAIGSIFPGAGTVIGGMVGGFLGGLIGSSLAKGATDKIVGKSEVEKLQEEQIEEQAAMISGDTASMNEINAYVQTMIQQDMADDGKLTEDSQKMLEYLQSGTLNNAYDLYTNTGTTGSTGLDELIARVQTGDTSVYNVPDDVLNASANSSNLSFSGGYANNYTNFGYTNPYVAGASNEVINYFG